MQFSSKDNNTDLQHLSSGDLCSCSSIPEKDVKTRQKGEALEPVTEAHSPRPTCVSTIRSAMGTNPPTPSLVTLCCFIGCDALSSWHFFFARAFIGHLFPGLNTKACSILRYTMWAVGRSGHITSHQQRWVNQGTGKGPWARPAAPVPNQHLRINTEVLAYSRLAYQEQENRLLRRVLKGNTTCVGFALLWGITHFQMDANSAHQTIRGGVAGVPGRWWVQPPAIPAETLPGLMFLGWCPGWRKKDQAQLPLALQKRTPGPVPEEPRQGCAGC